MDPLTLLQQERATLVDRRDKARAMLDRLEAELSDIDTAVRVLERAMGKQPSPHSTLRHPIEGHKPQIKSVIRDVLRQRAPHGVTVHDVVRLANDTGLVTVSQNTASVTLGRLKSEGEARLEGRVWFSAGLGGEAAEPAQQAPP
jgi:hypothetical protein